jgi:hypothetical protein
VRNLAVIRQYNEKPLQVLSGEAGKKLCFKRISLSQVLMPVILGTQETEIRKIKV